VAGFQVLAAMLIAISASGQSTVCRSTVPAHAGAFFFMESVKPAATDTVARVRLCLRTPAAKVGSYSATISFDAASMRAVRYDAAGGLQTANTTIAGAVKIAGASLNGFAGGELGTLVFKPTAGRAIGQLKLTLLESNSPTGVSLLGATRVQGIPATNKTMGVVQAAPVTASSEDPSRSTRPGIARAPRIDSISPRAAQVDAEGVTHLVLYGRNFTATANAVLFAGATIEGLLSESGGTVIRFTAPTRIPATASAPAYRVEPGQVEVKVRTIAGTSNAVTFTVRGEVR
jgi:hypothetical protein